MAKDLTELHIRKLERPGRARVRVTHLTNGLVIDAEGVDRHEAKLNAYADLAARLGLTGAAASYTDGANQARQNYFDKLREDQDGDFRTI